MEKYNAGESSEEEESSRDGESLSEDEELTISVDFLRFKSREVLESAKKLIPKNMKDRSGRSLLHWACYFNQVKKAQYLLSARLVDLGLRDNENRTALELAASIGYEGLYEDLNIPGSREVYFIEHALRINPLQECDTEAEMVKWIYWDNLDAFAEVFYSYTKNVNGLLGYCQYYESTLAEVAAYCLSPKCLNFLIENGAALESPDNKFGVFHIVLERFKRFLPSIQPSEFINSRLGVQCVDVCLRYIFSIEPYRGKLNELRQINPFMDKPTTETEEIAIHEIVQLQARISYILDS